jgi:hypothetical protein
VLRFARGMRPAHHPATAPCWWLSTAHCLSVSHCCGLLLFCPLVVAQDLKFCYVEGYMHLKSLVLCLCQQHDPYRGLPVCVIFGLILALVATGWHTSQHPELHGRVLPLLLGLSGIRCISNVPGRCILAFLLLVSRSCVTDADFSLVSVQVAFGGLACSGVCIVRYSVSSLPVGS